MVEAKPHPRAATALAFGLMGAFSLAAQTALFREYLVVYEGNELGAGVFFSSWLLWVGAGAALSLLVLGGRKRTGPDGTEPEDEDQDGGSAHGPPPVKEPRERRRRVRGL